MNLNEKLNELDSRAAALEYITTQALTIAALAGPDPVATVENAREAYYAKCDREGVASHAPGRDTADRVYSSSLATILDASPAEPTPGA